MHMWWEADWSNVICGEAERLRSQFWLSDSVLRSEKAGFLFMTVLELTIRLKPKAGVVRFRRLVQDRM